VSPYIAVYAYGVSIC